MKFGFKIFYEPENDGSGISSTDTSESDTPTLAQALAADRGIVTIPVSGAPAATNEDPIPVPASAQPTSEPASPQVPAANANGTTEPDEPPLPPGVAPNGVTPNSAAIAAQNEQLAARQAQYIQNSQLQAMYQQAIQAGATPEQAKTAIQLLTAQNTIRSQQEALENHPVTREIAAKQIAGVYAKWGVKPEDIISAPNPQAMQYAAYTLAQANKANGNATKTANLKARQTNGNDSFESGTAGNSGQVIDYKKSSGFSLMKRALALPH